MARAPFVQLYILLLLMKTNPGYCPDKAVMTTTWV